MKAVLVTADPTKPMVEVEGSSIRELAREHWDHPGGRYPERVNTVRMADFGFLMVVDDDGRDHNLPVNIRAMLIAQYRGGPLVGDVLLVCEARFEDGINFTSVGSHVLETVNRWQIQELAEHALLEIYRTNTAHLN